MSTAGIPLVGAARLRRDPAVIKQEVEEVVDKNAFLSIRTGPKTLRAVTLLEEGKMSEIDEYRANLAVCWRMANKAPNEQEKRAWLDMAESWRLLIITDDQRSADEQFDGVAHGYSTGPFNPIPDVRKASLFVQLRLELFRRRWFSARNRSLARSGTALGRLFVWIIQGAGALLWLALDAFNRRRDAHHQRDIHRIGTARRRGELRRDVAPGRPSPSGTPADAARPTPASHQARRASPPWE